MVSRKRLFISAVTVTTCIGMGETFAGPREAGTYVFNAARSLWKRTSDSPLRFPKPTQSPEPHPPAANTMKVVDVDSALAKGRNIKPCREGTLGYGKNKYSNQHEICSYSLHRSAASENVDRDTIIQRLNSNRDKAAETKGSSLIRSRIEPGR